MREELSRGRRENVSWRWRRRQDSWRGFYARPKGGTSPDRASRLLGDVVRAPRVRPAERSSCVSGHRLLSACTSDSSPAATPLTARSGCEAVLRSSWPAKDWAFVLGIASRMSQPPAPLEHLVTWRVGAPGAVLSGLSGVRQVGPYVCRLACVSGGECELVVGSAHVTPKRLCHWEGS